MPQSFSVRNSRFEVSAVKKKTTYEEICAEVRRRASTDMKNIVDVCDQPLVSSDFVGNPHTCIFDEKAGIMISPKFVKLVAWYDNEYGYSSKLLDLIATMYKKDHAHEKKGTAKEKVAKKSIKKEEKVEKKNCKKPVSQKTVKQPKKEKAKK